VTGDVTQIDLPLGKRSGLVEALEICGKIEGMEWCSSPTQGCGCAHLVQRIIRAYEEYEVQHPLRGTDETSRSTLKQFFRE